jgi:hypothetical protein
MNYVVSGADRATGKELTLRFQASSRADAEAFAGLSMFVSEVREEQPAVEAVAYAAPGTGKSTSEVNWAAGIAFHARLLGILSLVVALTAILPLGYFVWGLALKLWDLFVDRSAQSALSLAAYAATSPALFLAVALIGFAVIIRLASYLALAIREIAIKS